jgi:hypothetical protein
MAGPQSAFCKMIDKRSKIHNVVRSPRGWRASGEVAELAEGAPLLRVYRGNSVESSNLSLSAIFQALTGKP